MKSVASFIALNVTRIVIIGFASIFAVCGLILFIWFADFREELFK